MKLLFVLILLTSCSYHYEYSFPSDDTEQERNTDGTSSKK